MRSGSIACVLVAACSSDTGGSIPIENLQAAYTAYSCNLAVRCGLAADFATCRKLRRDDLIDPNIIAAVEAGGVVYDGSAARTCLEATFASCDRSIVVLHRNAPAACAEMFSGTVASNGPCGLDQDCISQRCSNADCLANGTPTGTCIGDAPRMSTVGEPCQFNNDCFASYCDSAALTCLALLGAGASCIDDSQCEVGLTCRGSCVALAGTGGPCTTDNDCERIGDYCASGTCVAFALAGGDCTSAACIPGYRCDATMHCVLGPELGEHCSAPLYCVDGSYCDSGTGTCIPLLPDNATCSSNEQCASRTCVYQQSSSTGTCVTLVCT